MRYLITPEPAQHCETGYLAASTVNAAYTDASLEDDAYIVDAFARNERAQAAQGANHAAPAVGVPVHNAQQAPPAAQPAAQVPPELAEIGRHATSARIPPFCTPTTPRKRRC